MKAMGPGKRKKGKKGTSVEVPTEPEPSYGFSESEAGTLLRPPGMPPMMPSNVEDDIKAVALQVVSHRIMLKPESKIRGVTGHHIMRKILSEVPVPVIQ